MHTIFERFSALEIADQRHLDDEYGELVFYCKDRDRWEEVLQSIFGPPIKPQGSDPSDYDNQLAEGRGGIRSNQTLFKKEISQKIVVAMLWPWQDEVHITLKVFFA